MNDKQLFARIAQNIECGSDVMAVGYMMRDWLETAIVDAGTSVDQGAGMEQFDLWCKVNGRTLYINVKQK